MYHTHSSLAYGSASLSIVFYSFSRDHPISHIVYTSLTQPSALLIQDQPIHGSQFEITITQASLAYMKQQEKNIYNSI